MLCQSCLKNNATACIKTMVNGETRELILCSECANKLGYNNLFNDFSFAFDDFFKGFWGNETHFLEDQIRCKKCGSSFDDIVNSGKVGCPDCYDVFYNKMLPLIERIHGNTTHKGKKALLEDQSKSNISEIVNLKRELKELIDKQEFEKAALIRDRIKDLENRRDNNE